MRKLLGVVLLLLGCGVRYTSTTTRGVACADLADALCGKFISCGSAPESERAPCLSGFTNGCCGEDRTCGDRVFNPEGAANCVNSIPGDGCAQFNLQTGSLPAYCRQMF